MKCCTKCGVEKPLTEFHSDKQKKDGYASACKPCKLTQNRPWKSNNPEKARELNKRWAENNPEKDAESKRKWELANKDAVLARQKRWQELNREKVRAKASAWKRRNPEKTRELVMRRHAAKLKATPPWFEAPLVAAVYVKASELGLEVDHIVPLRSKTVCGLHCWANLQLLSKDINASKGNRLWPDMPE